MRNNFRCDGIRRRNFLQVGLGAMLGGTAFRGLGAAPNGAPGEAGVGSSAVAKSCILIWLDGGPTHFETFDPKPLAPAEIRGVFEPIATKTPGTYFSEHMTKLAGISDKFTLIRSICHDQGNHGAGNHYMMTGAPPRIPVGCGAFVSFHPSMGSVTAHQRGNAKGLPAYFSLPSMTRSGGPNFLGAQYSPFVVPDDPNNANFRVRDVALPNGLDQLRFDRRQHVRKQVDQLVRITDAAAADPVKALDEYYGQSRDLMLSESAQAAFNIHKEDPKVRDLYGRDSFGQRALLARRLVEAGVPFIVLNNGGWDSHGDLFPDMVKRLPPFESVVATLILDLEQRGLLDSTLITVLGEFGRTPKLSTLPGASGPGRDHWSQAMSVLMAGAKIPGGQTIGATDRYGYSAVDRVLSPEKFVSSIYRKLGIDPDTMLYTPQGRPTHLVSDPTPIDELFV
jgi:hypothetical protein